MGAYCCSVVWIIHILRLHLVANGWCWLSACFCRSDGVYDFWLVRIWIVVALFGRAPIIECVARAQRHVHGMT